MIPYASRTGTKINLDLMRANRWGLLVTPVCLRTEGFDLYALDNGAWSAYQKGEPFNESAFIKAVEQLGQDAQFIVVPDIVCGGLDSLAYSLSWLPKLQGFKRLLIAVQDGMRACDVRHLVSSSVGIFVGGSSEWKEQSLRIWGQLASETGCYLHVGRVNTRRRIRLCQDAGADSFDGTSASRFAKTIPLIDNSVRQLHMWEK